MRWIIDHFVRSSAVAEGHGCFARNAIAIKFAKKLTKSQKQKWGKHGIVPLAFYAYLEFLGCIAPIEDTIPKKRRTVEDIEERLGLRLHR